MGMVTGRRLAVVAPLLLAVALPGCEGGSAEERGGEGGGEAVEAEAAISGLFEAMNANDTDRLLSYYHDGDDLVQVACTEIRRGYRQVEPLVRMWQEDQPETRIEHQVVRTTALGRDGAVVVARGRNHQGLALFWTFVLRRDDRGDWRIVQEHQSWPDCREPRIHPMG